MLSAPSNVSRSRSQGVASSREHSTKSVNRRCDFVCFFNEVLFTNGSVSIINHVCVFRLYYDIMLCQK